MEKEMGRINNVLQKKCKRCSNLVGADDAYCRCIYRLLLDNARKHKAAFLVRLNSKQSTPLPLFSIANEMAEIEVITCIKKSPES